MPFGDGTGPVFGSGPGTGTGSGAYRSTGRGRMGGSSRGPVGDCVCPSCKKTIPHQRGVPCFQMKCPECNTSLVRG